MLTKKIQIINGASIIPQSDWNQSDETKADYIKNKPNYDEKYTKPSTGIPKTDLESDVQVSLDKADTALQSHQDISGKQDKIDSDNKLSASLVSGLATVAISGSYNDLSDKPSNSSEYILPVASTVLGGVKSGTGITVDSNGNVSVNDDSHNHIISNIDGLQTALDSKSDAEHTHAYIPTSQKGSANGVAELDSNGKVPSSQLPSYVDDVIEGYYYNSEFYEESSHTTVIIGEAGKIYIDIDTNKTYRWSGSTFVVISETLALGETSTTAYRGDRGKIAYDHSQDTHARVDATKTEASSTNGNIIINGTETTVYTHPSGTNPHGTTKSDVGLGNVGNFKAVSTVDSQGLTDTEKSNARANIGAGTYSKPSTGIPLTDFASAVQTSLNKADTALQDITIDSAMSDTSTNAVQNKVIKAYVDAVKTEIENAITGGAW